MLKKVLRFGLSAVLAVGAPMAIIGAELAGPAAVVATGASTEGCTTAQWQNFQNNAATFVQYTQTFLQTVMTVWTSIAPLLGQNTAAAQKIFNDAYVVCTNSVGVFLDGVKAVAAGQTLDLQALMAPVQDACAKLLAIVAQFQMTATGAGVDPNSVLQKQAKTIWAWKAN